MAVPRNRHSNARKMSKRAHQAKKPKQFKGCSNCGAMKLPHVLCPSCGFYGSKFAVEAASSEG
ncbi:MAG: 50S ribosomal protein L32 [Chlamydiales bacterium]